MECIIIYQYFCSYVVGSRVSSDLICLNWNWNWRISGVITNPLILHKSIDYFTAYVAHSPDIYVTITLIYINICPTKNYFCLNLTWNN